MQSSDLKPQIQSKIGSLLKYKPKLPLTQDLAFIIFDKNILIHLITILNHFWRINKKEISQNT